MPYLWVRRKKMKTSVNLARIWIHWSTISAPSWWRSKTRSAIQICWVRTSLRWPLWVSSTRFRVKWAHCPLKPGVMAVTRSDLVVHCPTQRRACMGSKWNSILSLKLLFNRIDQNLFKVLIMNWRLNIDSNSYEILLRNIDTCVLLVPYVKLRIFEIRRKI